MKGGVSNLAQRYWKINREFIKLKIKNQLSFHIIYLDKNNLCGWARMQYLLKAEFWSLTQTEIKKLM